MKAVTVMISDDPILCKGCRAINYEGYRCNFAYAFIIPIDNEKWWTAVQLGRDEGGKITKCRWCLETYPVEPDQR